MLPELQKLIDDYDDSPEKDKVFKQILKLPGTHCTVVLLKILDGRVDTKMKLLTLNVWQEWAKEYLPQLFVQPAGTMPAILTDMQKHALILARQVHMGDVLQLRPLTCRAEEKLARRGTWWRTIQAHDYDHTKPIPVTAANRPPSWFLKSLTRKEQGLPAVPGDKKNPTDNLWLRKENDPDYQIINICTFPKEFKYKDWADKPAQ